jgi:hypothetical protein
MGMTASFIANLNVRRSEQHFSVWDDESLAKPLNRFARLDLFFLFLHGENWKRRCTVWRIMLLQSRKYTRVQGEVKGKLEAKIDYRFKKPSTVWYLSDA